MASGTIDAGQEGRNPTVAKPTGHAQRDVLMRRPDLDDLPTLAMPEGFILRLALPDEAGALAVLLTRAFEVTWDEDLVRHRLTEAADVEAIYVVVHDGALVATASARVAPEEFPGSGYLHWVGADPDFQGKGLGRLVVLRVLIHFREAGLRDAVLETQDHLTAPLRTYLRLGFLPEYREEHDRRRWSRAMPRLVR